MRIARWCAFSDFAVVIFAVKSSALPLTKNHVALGQGP